MTLQELKNLRVRGVSIECIRETARLEEELYWRALRKQFAVVRESEVEKEEELQEA